MELCLQRRPLRLLRHPFQRGPRAATLDLVLIVASDREILRMRRHRLFRLAGSGLLIVAAIGTLLLGRGADANSNASGAQQSAWNDGATASGSSAGVELHAGVAMAAPPSLRLDLMIADHLRLNAAASD